MAQGRLLAIPLKLALWVRHIIVVLTDNHFLPCFLANHATAIQKARQVTYLANHRNLLNWCTMPYGLLGIGVADIVMIIL
jgi:hypothetical protein